MKIIGLESVVKVYDPRKKEDLFIDLEFDETFSTLDHDFFTLTIFPEIRFFKGKSSPVPESDINELVKAALTKTATQGFFSYSSITKKIKSANLPEFSNINEIKGSAINYFENSCDNISRIEGFRSKLQSYEEWIIGSCFGPFKKPEKQLKNGKTVLWDLSFLLRQPQNIGALIYFNGETGGRIVLFF